MTTQEHIHLQTRTLLKSQLHGILSVLMLQKDTLHLQDGQLGTELDHLDHSRN